MERPPRRPGDRHGLDSDWDRTRLVGGERIVWPNGCRRRRGMGGLIWLIGNGAGGAFAPGRRSSSAGPGHALLLRRGAVDRPATRLLRKVLLEVCIALPCAYSRYRYRLTVVAVSGLLARGGNANALTKNVSDNDGDGPTPRPVVDRVARWRLCGNDWGRFQPNCHFVARDVHGGLWYASTHSVNWPITVLIVVASFFG